MTLLYIYAGYPVLVWMLAKLFGRKVRKQAGIPPVSLLIPAYNEEAHIEAKLLNSLALDYPKARLEIVVASDGSTDGTNALVERFRAQGVKLFALRDNIGKSAMLGRTVPLL
ncbi:MAG TPA: glycosyltransferase, partial [archaeon]|nr:glycosyltransferase [archaeon]